jgi:hypothetical protein
VKRLSGSVDNLSKNVGKEVGPVIHKPPGISNLYDSADPLINMHSNGLLTVGGN